MNFQAKNFSYVTKEFGRFVDDVYAGSRQYLRAISSEKPAEVPANLCADFPSLKNDFRLPPELALVANNTHSSPFRLSGPVTLWLHYDVRTFLYPLHQCARIMLIGFIGIGQRSLPDPWREKLNPLSAMGCISTGVPSRGVKLLRKRFPGRFC